MRATALRRFLGNAASLFACDAANRATSFVLYVLVARYLGTLQFGRLAVALTILSTCQFIAVGGLKTYATREIARDRSRTRESLANSSLVVCSLSLLCTAFLWVFVRALGYPEETRTLIVVLSLGLIPYSLSAMAEAVFQAWERMRYIAYANLAAQAVKLGGAVLVLKRGYGLPGLALVIIVAHILTFLIECGFLRSCLRPLQLSFDGRLAWRLVKSGSPFLGMDVIIGVMGSVNVVLLSKLAGEREAGLYSAATQLMVPVALLLQNGVIPALPVMSRKFESSFESLKGIAADVMELLVALAVPAAVGLALVAEPALLLLYQRAEFAQAIPAVRILSGTLVLTAMTPVLSFVLVAGRQENRVLHILFAGLIMDIVLGLALIPWLGVTGAALALLLRKLISFALQYRQVAPLFRIPLVRLMWRPLVASGCMAALLVAMREHGMLIATSSAAGLYGIVLFALAAWSVGGPRQFKARYLYGWSE